MSFLSREDRDLFDEIFKEQEDIRRDIHALKDEGRDVERVKDHSLRNLLVSGVVSVTVALIGGSAIVAASEDPVPAEPAPVSCSQERNRARMMYERDGGWVPIPESSPSEQQCDINGYIGSLTSAQ